MIKKVIPDCYYKKIQDIPYTKLYEEGYRLILTDLDNTLISYLEKEPTSELFEWKKRIEEIGFEVIIVSNSRKDRVAHFASLLNVPYVKFAKKPLKFGLKKGIRLAKKEYSKNQIIEIGDQLMTDVFGARRTGLYTILVQAIDRKTEIFTTRWNRRIEKFFLRRIRKKYPFLFEEKLKSYVEDNYDSETL